jgi:hypothetical protein
MQFKFIGFGRNVYREALIASAKVFEEMETRFQEREDAVNQQLMKALGIASNERFVGDLDISALPPEYANRIVSQARANYKFLGFDSADEAEACFRGNKLSFSLGLSLGVMQNSGRIGSPPILGCTEMTLVRGVLPP